MTRFSSVAAVVSLLLSPDANSAPTLAECDAFASDLNKSYPQRVDKYTTVRGTTCVQEKTRRILIYRMALEFGKSEVDSNKMETNRKTQRANWCSSPQMRPLLKLVDIRYIYFDVNGVYVTETNHRIEDC